MAQGNTSGIKHSPERLPAQEKKKKKTSPFNKLGFACSTYSTNTNVFLHLKECIGSRSHQKPKCAIHIHIHACTYSHTHMLKSLEMTAE